MKKVFFPMKNLIFSMKKVFFSINNLKAPIKAPPSISKSKPLPTSRSYFPPQPSTFILPGDIRDGSVCPLFTPSFYLSLSELFCFLFFVSDRPDRPPTTQRHSAPQHHSAPPKKPPSFHIHPTFNLHSYFILQPSSLSPLTLSLIPNLFPQKQPPKNKPRKSYSNFQVPHISKLSPSIITRLNLASPLHQRASTRYPEPYTRYSRAFPNHLPITGKDRHMIRLCRSFSIYFLIPKLSEYRICCSKIHTLCHIH